MKKLVIVLAIVAVIVLGFTATGYAAQSPGWSSIGGGQSPSTHCLYSCNGVLYAGSSGSVWAWNGSSWSQIGNLPIGEADVNSLVSDNGVIYAGTSFGTWAWNGSSWSLVGNSISSVQSLITVNGIVYAGTSAGVCSWNGSAWSQVGNGSTGGSLAAVGEVIYAGTYQGVYYWDGSTWSQAGNLGVTTLITVNGAVYAGTGSDGVWSWNGSTWSRVGDLTGDAAWVECLALGNGMLYSGAWGGDVSVWNGLTWTNISSGSGEYLSSLAVVNGTLYEGTEGSIGVSYWNGSSWLPAGGFSGDLASIKSITTVNGTVYAGLESSNDVYFWSGSSWCLDGSLPDGVDCLTTVNDAVYGGGGWGVYYWNGSTWSAIGNPPFSSGEVTSLATVDNTIYAGVIGGVYCWNGSTWSTLGVQGNPSSDAYVYSLIYANGTLYAGTGDGGSGNDAVYSWNGSSWSKLGTNLGYISSLVTDNNGTLYAGLGGTWGGGVWLWNGSTWTQVGGANGLSGNAKYVQSLIAYNGIVYAGTSAGVWSWNGSTWSQVSAPINTMAATCLAIANGTLYAGTGTGGVWSYDLSQAPAAPAISPNGGFVSSTQTVGINASITSLDQTVYYTIASGSTGITPTLKSLVYSATFSLPVGTHTVEAAVYDSVLGVWSSAASATFYGNIVQLTTESAPSITTTGSAPIGVIDITETGAGALVNNNSNPALTLTLPSRFTWSSSPPPTLEAVWGTWPSGLPQLSYINNNGRELDISVPAGEASTSAAYLRLIGYVNVDEDAAQYGNVLVTVGGAANYNCSLLTVATYPPPSGGSGGGSGYTSTVTGVSPVAGPIAGGITETISGVNLGVLSAVYFGSVCDTSVTANAAGTQLTTTLPAASEASTVDVTAYSNIYGLSSSYVPFTYYAPAINNVVTLNDSNQNPVTTTVNIPLPPASTVGSNSLAINLGGNASISIPAGASLPGSITVQPVTPPVANALAFQFGATGGNYNGSFEMSITITLPVPSGMTNPQVYYQDTNGIWELCGGTVSNNTITFTTTHFSTYAVGTGLASKPVANPGAGTYASSQKVTLSSSGAAKILYYTATGTAPTSFDYTQSYTTINSASSTLSISSSENLVAVGIDTNGFASLPLIATYMINTSSGGGGGGGGATPANSDTPAVQTAATSSITGASAVLNGSITSDNGYSVTDYGFIWGTSTNNLTNKLDVGSNNQSGAFNGNLTGLTAGTTYYFKAYATNSQGTADGIQMSFTTTGAAPATTTTPTTPAASTILSDVPSSFWGYNAISALSVKGIVYGYPDGTFKPNATVTRAEFATMLVKALGLSTSRATGAFTDVTPADWYYSSVNTAVANGLVSGLGNGLFAPNDLITREQMAVMVANALGNKAPTVDGAELKAFSDKSAVSSWAVTSIQETAKAGIVSGITTDTLAPQANATRVQAAAMIYNLLGVTSK